MERFCQPFGGEALGVFALRVVIIEKRPAVAFVEILLEGLEIDGRSALVSVARELSIKPETCSQFESGMSAGFVQREHKASGTHEMRTLIEEAFALAQGFANEAELSIFEVPKSAVNDARGATGGSGGEVVLFEKEHTPACARTLSRNGDTVDSSTDHYDFESCG